MLSDIPVNELNTSKRLKFTGHIALSGSAEYLNGAISTFIVGEQHHDESYTDVSLTSPKAMPRKPFFIKNGSITFRSGDYKTSGDITLLHESGSRPKLIVEEGSSLTISKGTKLKIEFSVGD